MSVRASAARHLAPRLPVPRVWLAWKAEDTFGEDVFVHLGGATLDRVGTAAQHPAHLERQAVRVALRTGGVLVGGGLPRGGVGAEQVGGEHLCALVKGAGMNLPDGAFGAGSAAGLEQRPHP